MDEVTDTTVPWYLVGDGGHFRTITACHVSNVFFVDHARAAVTLQSRDDFLAQ